MYCPFPGATKACVSIPQVKPIGCCTKNRGHHNLLNPLESTLFTINNAKHIHSIFTIMCGSFDFTLFGFCVKNLHISIITKILFVAWNIIKKVSFDNYSGLEGPFLKTKTLSSWKPALIYEMKYSVGHPCRSQTVVKAVIIVSEGSPCVCHSEAGAPSLSPKSNIKLSKVL